MRGPLTQDRRPKLLIRGTFTGAMSESTPTPQIYIAKYNRFVDGIIGSINKILRRSYDPVNVRLQNAEEKNTKKTKTNNRRKHSQRRKNAQRSRTHGANTEDVIQNKMLENDNMTRIETIMPDRIPAAKDKVAANSTQQQAQTVAETENRATTTKSGNKRKSDGNTKTKKKNGNKQTKLRQQPAARGTLYGLSSLKRSGDVKINMMADYTTVKTNFILGPLILRVEKEFGRGAKRELKSATATTAEMLGRISLRVVKGGAATLHSIKVQQPRAVSVESADDHDRTREFVWRRSAHISRVVSQQLTNAAKSMLQPPPVAERKRTH